MENILYISAAKKNHDRSFFKEAQGKEKKETIGNNTILFWMSSNTSNLLSYLLMLHSRITLLNPFKPIDIK